MAQLVNILARITLYKLLKILKITQEDLGEALADIEVFTAQNPEGAPKEQQESFHTFRHPTCIIFSSEVMQVKSKHDIPQCFTGYIGLLDVNRIQVDPGTALSIALVD